MALRVFVLGFLAMAWPALAEAQVTALPVTNPGFETGNIGGWTYSADEGLAAYQIVPQSEMPNRFALAMVGTGFLPPPASFTREATFSQEVVMPNAENVRWTFYVSIYPLIEQWFSYPGATGAGFRARIAGDRFTIEARVAMRLLLNGTRRYQISLPQTWSVQQWSLGRDHWTFTTDDLRAWFQPGETLTVTFVDAFQVGVGGSKNAPYATVDDRPPAWLGIEPIPLADNVDLVTLAMPWPSFRRGDSNADGGVDLSDAVYTLQWRFVAGFPPPCPDAADANDDGQIDISDAIFTLAWRFLGGPPPPAPGPTACGPDPTADALGVCYDPGC